MESPAICLPQSNIAGFSVFYIKIELPAPLDLQHAGRVTVMIDDKKKQYITPVFESKSAMRNQAENFIKLIKGEKAAPADNREALKDLKIARDYINLFTK